MLTALYFATGSALLNYTEVAILLSKKRTCPNHETLAIYMTVSSPTPHPFYRFRRQNMQELLSRFWTEQMQEVGGYWCPSAACSHV